MPQKTKKQKLLAQKRREQEMLTPSYSLSPSIAIKKETVGTTQSHVIHGGHSVVFDIWKIIVLSLLAFSFEISVYWFLHRVF